MGKERASLHRGKAGSAIHNEHEFMEDKNVIIHSYVKGASLKEAEIEFYRERYSEMLTQQNEKYMAKRQYARCKTMEEVYDSKRYKPTEEITQWGNVNSDRLPTRDEYEQMTAEYFQKKIEWAKLHGNHVHVLDYSNHYDESTPHTHEREAIDYIDENGVIRLGQEEGLKQSGVELPDPTKPVSRYNNRGMTYTAMCRDMWYDVCEAHGFEVEREPAPRRRKHESVDEFQSRMDREAQNRAESSLKAQEDVLRQKAKDLDAERQKFEFEASVRLKEHDRREQELAEREREANERYDEMQEKYDEMAKWYGKFKSDHMRAHAAMLQKKQEEAKAAIAKTMVTAEGVAERERSQGLTKSVHLDP